MPTTPLRQDWIHLFFSSAGRLPRTPFLVAILVLLGVFAIYEGLVQEALHGLTAWAVHGVLLFAAACVLSKRLHDRGRSGWWAAVVLLAFVMVWPQPRGFFDFVFVVVLLWAVVELAAMPGEQGANRFGPPPLR